MAHALGGNLGGHSGYHQAQPGGWWKLMLTLLVATGIGVGLVHSPLLEQSDGTHDSALPEVVLAVSEVSTLAGLRAEDQPASEPARPAHASQAVAATTSASVSIPVKDITIRDIDYTSLPFLRALAQQLAGRVDQSQITYADLTRDGADDSIVAITSDGTYGNIGYAAFTMKAGAPEPILVRVSGAQRRGLVLTYEQGQLVEHSAVYGPTDANCCPSQILKTYYQWDGRTLAAERIETIVIPQGPKAD